MCSFPPLPTLDGMMLKSLPVDCLFFCCLLFLWIQCALIMFSTDLASSNIITSRVSGRGHRIGAVCPCVRVSVCPCSNRRTAWRIYGLWSITTKGLWGEGTLQHGSREVRQRSGVFISKIFGQKNTAGILLWIQFMKYKPNCLIQQDERIILFPNQNMACSQKSMEISKNLDISQRG